MESSFIFNAFSFPLLSSVSRALEERIDMPRPDFIPSLTAVEEPNRATTLKESILSVPAALKYSLIIFNVPEPVSRKIKGSLNKWLIFIFVLSAHLCPLETASTSSSSQSSVQTRLPCGLFDPTTPSSRSPFKTLFSISLVSAIFNITDTEGCFS